MERPDAGSFKVCSCCICISLHQMTLMLFMHMTGLLILPVLLPKKISGKPLVVHVHATEFDRSGENINQNVYDIESKGMEAADMVITVSILHGRLLLTVMASILIRLLLFIMLLNR